MSKINTSRSEPKYIFYAKIIEGYRFKVLIKIIKTSFQTKKVSLKVNKNGIFICMYDEQNNILIESSFLAKFMKKFIFSSSTEFLFGLSITLLLDEIKKLEKQDILTIACEKDSQMVIVLTSNPDKNKKINKLLHNIIVKKYN